MTIIATVGKNMLVKNDPLLQEPRKAGQLLQITTHGKVMEFDGVSRFEGQTLLIQEEGPRVEFVKGHLTRRTHALTSMLSKNCVGEIEVDGVSVAWPRRQRRATREVMKLVRKHCPSMDGRGLARVYKKVRHMCRKIDYEAKQKRILAQVKKRNKEANAAKA